MSLFKIKKSSLLDNGLLEVNELHCIVEFSFQIIIKVFYKLLCGSMSLINEM